MAGQLLTVGSVVAGDVGDDGHFAAHLGHHVLQDGLALFHALVDAFAGGAAYIQALHAFLQQILGKGPGAGGADGAVILVASVECGENPLVFLDIGHNCTQILSIRSVRSGK